MIKILEVIGLALVVVMFMSFVGFIPGVENGLSPVFWGCAAGALAIIFYRKKLREKQNAQ